MSFRLSSPRICLGAATLAVGGLLVCDAQPQRQAAAGGPSSFPCPESDEVTTNLHQLMSQPDGLKQLEEDLYKPPQSLDAGEFAGWRGRFRPARAATSVIQNKRVKEMLERRKNWVFMSPEDLLAAPTVEEILKAPELGPDGQEKKELPAMEHYYQRLATKRSAADNPSQTKNEELFGSPGQSKPRDELAVQDDSNLPSGLKESAQALKKLFEPGSSDSPFAQGAAHGSLSDTFGLGDNTLSKEQMRRTRSTWTNIAPWWTRVGIRPPWPSRQSAGQPRRYGSPQGTAGPPWRPSGTTPARGLEAQADVLNPMLGPAALPDVNAQALGQTRPAPALPKVEPTR